MVTDQVVDDVSVLDDLVHHALLTVPDRPQMERYLRAYYGLAAPDDLAQQRVEDLFGMAADHLQLVADWRSGREVIAVIDPRIDVDGWGSDNSVVLIVTDDKPFLVDSVTMEISRQGLGIHLAIHPIVPHEVLTEALADDERWNGRTGGDVSMISVGIDRLATPEARRELEDGLRRVLSDVSLAVADGDQMRRRIQEVSSALDPERLPVDADEVVETRAFLDWLHDDHFLFLGARDYELGFDDGEEVLRHVPGSGLGILSSEVRLGRPRRISELPPTARRRVHDRHLLNLTKASSRATVHRPAYLDYVGVKTFDDDGEVTGERRFLGLFTSEVYHRSISVIPRARKTAAAVLARSGFPAGGHDESRLNAILERYPRDDLLQMDADELFPIAMAIAGLKERRRVRVFARRETFGRFVTVLVYLPRDRYTTASRSGIERILITDIGGTLVDWDAQMTESVLARLRFVLRVAGGDTVEASSDGDAVEASSDGDAVEASSDGDAVEVPADASSIEAEIESLIRIWADDLAVALTAQYGEVEAPRLLARYGGSGFDENYKRAFEPRTAAADVAHLEALTRPGELRLQAYREPGRPHEAFKLKLYCWGQRVSLTSVMPTLTNLGVTVVDEWPYEVRTPEARVYWIYDFALERPSTDLDFNRVSELVGETIEATWAGRSEDDGFNRLVLQTGLGPQEVGVLRAYARYLHQIGFRYTPTAMAQAMLEHPAVVRLLIDLFRTRFDPDRPVIGREVGEAAIRADIASALNAIESLDHDRVLRRLANLIDATVRTTWGQREPDGQPRPYLAFKLSCQSVDDLPEPRPAFEIFVHSTRFEGVHLRAGPVARGGIRWSDRNEDYRTEILGLVKAQMVKNAVIIPVGAKGGFILKQRPTDPADIREEVVACYRLFISALLDLTDNLVEGSVVPPDRTRRYDGDDPYLVVAADKGTASFSDVANELSIERGFWLGDAFASGGSQGYDHKAMGITARGAWESVKRHFRELGLDVGAEPFRVVGIGDMSGDVFGNGMLRSPFTRLIAAFDHRHIFIDPDPDPGRSYAERKRLFDLPRSSWDDYDRDLLSAGGAIHPRTAKSIDLSAEAREALGTEAETVTPDELISIVLRAPVDLLWNGGIGTYIKASTERNTEVGDKANDAIRVDGCDLRCAVIGEGGNLGVTQRGRIEVAEAGGRIFTDAIDNAGGVDCSDHEVNIKILLDGVVADGDLTAKQRNAVLEEMTDDVGDLVLANNYRQALALVAARIDAPSLIEVHGRYLDDLEATGRIDRALEALPDVEELAERRQAGRGLTTPELAVVAAYTKNLLQDDLIASAVPDDEAMVPLLEYYFPAPIRERFADRIPAHRLRREIVANRLANLVVDRAGTTMLYRLAQETSAPAAELAAAHLAAWTIFDLEELVRAVARLDDTIGVGRQMAIYLSCRQLAERATRLLIRNRPNPFAAAEAIDDLAEPVGATLAGLDGDLLGIDRAAFEAQRDELREAGVPDDLARRVAVLPTAVAALDIVAVADAAARPIREVSATYHAVADALDLNWLRDRILALHRDDQWSSLARLTLRTELYADHRQLTAQVIADPGCDSPAGPETAVERVQRWVQGHRMEVERFRQTMVAIRSTSTDVTSLLVAAREVRNLIGRTRFVASPLEPTDPAS